MSGWEKSADDRVDAFREEYERAGESTAHLSDLELLNRAYESVLREQIDTRDRYMSLLTELRKHDDAVRKAATRALKNQADRYAHRAVNEFMRPFDAVLYRIENLPDRPGPRQMQGLRQAADTVRLQLRHAPNHPQELNDLEGARHTLRTLRHVVGVLDTRDGLDTSEVLRLVKAALGDEALTDLFATADQGTPKPHPQQIQPPFAGPSWDDLGGLWAYQPDGTGAHVKAYVLGEDWYLDLWSTTGQLLAFGTVPDTEVAALAQSLVSRADEWARDRSGYAWRRFADTVQATRTAETLHPQDGGNGTTPISACGNNNTPSREAVPNQVRARMATATSLNRPADIPTAFANPEPARAYQPQSIATRRSR